MSFKDFVTHVSKFLRKNNISSEVFYKAEDGKYIARISDEVTIIGNSVCKMKNGLAKVQVGWGTGHIAHAYI